MVDASNIYVVAPFSDARVRGHLINVLRRDFGTLEKAEESHNLGLSDQEVEEGEGSSNSSYHRS